MRRLPLACALLLLPSCQNLVAKQEEPSYPVEISVESDPQRPLSGVAIGRTGGGKLLGTTGPEGKATFVLHGAAGEFVSLEVTCPPDFLPAKAISVKLQTLASGKPVGHKVVCTPMRRKAIFSILADATPPGTFHKDKAIPLAGMKVKVFGVEYAVTDESGAAHVMMDVNPDETVKVTVEAPENNPKKLTPALLPFDIPMVSRDEIYPIAASFRASKEAAPKPAAKPSGPKQLKGPQRI